MRPPNIRLSDVGFGSDKVMVYSKRYDQDLEGNRIERPGVPVAYRAIVEGMPGMEMLQNGAEDSVTAYTILLYTQADPGVRDGDAVAWRGIILQAKSDAVRSAAGAWTFPVVEIQQAAPGSPTPFGV